MAFCLSLAASHKHSMTPQQLFSTAGAVEYLLNQSEPSHYEGRVAKYQLIRVGILLHM